MRTEELWARPRQRVMANAYDGEACRSCEYYDRASEDFRARGG